MDGNTVIHDPIYGSVSVDGPYLELLDRHEVQRLRRIKQLGNGFSVFPGANHTRFEHSLGVYHLSGRMSQALELNKEDTDTVRAAGLLHDICHAPFSHALEELMEKITGKDHMDLARELIHGRMPYFMKRDANLIGGIGPMSEILEDSGISSEEVCDLISYPSTDVSGISIDSNQSFFNSRDYIHQIIHGPVDADQMDYLLRDAHYTGVSYGSIDMDRLLSQMKVRNNKMVLGKGGIVAAEGLMVSRVLMYSSVYLHKTVRIGDKMLEKAAEAAIESGADLSEIYLMDDSDIISLLSSAGGPAAEIVRSIRFRNLYKKSFVLYSNDLSEDDKAELVRFTGYEARKSLEEQIANRAGLEKHEVIVDIPSKSTLLSKIKVGKTDVLIDDGSKIRPVTSFSPLAKSLQTRNYFDWSIMVSAPEGKQEAVRKAAKGLIGIEISL